MYVVVGKMTARTGFSRPYNSEKRAPVENAAPKVKSVRYSASVQRRTGDLKNEANSSRPPPSAQPLSGHHQSSKTSDEADQFHTVSLASDDEEESTAATARIQQHGQLNNGRHHARKDSSQIESRAFNGKHLVRQCAVGGFGYVEEEAEEVPSGGSGLMNKSRNKRRASLPVDLSSRPYINSVSKRVQLSEERIELEIPE